MGSDTNGAVRRVSAEQGLNVFALVIYIPYPLGRFLDDLRRELVPNCDPKAHVSVLPPRSLAVSWQTASRTVRSLTEGWAPFDIELTGIEVFPITNVIYLAVGGGAAQLFDMHATMNQNGLAFDEPFDYHPHVTLAQEFPSEEVESLRETAARRWREFTGPRRFRAERAVFVQNKLPNFWTDLDEYILRGAPEAGRLRV